MFRGLENLKNNGFAIHWLRPKSKAPIAKEWSEVKPPSWEQLKKSFRDNFNVGVRLGKWSKLPGDYYLHVVDFDVRVASEIDNATTALRIAFPDYESYPTVRSGSMGLSRHYYIVCEEPFPTRKIAHSKEKHLGKEGKWHWNWEIELFGTGKQVAIPPSIHPDTGKPYAWIREMDFDNLYFSIGPIVKPEILAALTLGGDEPEDLTEDNRADRQKPIGLTMNQARALLARLPKAEYCDDRDGWLHVGMALHHEFSGSTEAFDTWIGYSRQSEKFDKKDQLRVWRSFKTKAKARPLRMATLQSAVRDYELELEFENLEDGDDLDENFTQNRSKTQKIPTNTAYGQFFENFLQVSDEEQEEIDGSERARKIRKSNIEAALGKIPPKVARLNKKHAIAFVKGKTVVITEADDGDVSYGSLTDLHAWYENDRVATEKATEPITKAWARHKLRREYPNGIIFAPNKEVKGYYNHWRGFDVEPDPDGSCARILYHIKNIVCRGIKEQYDYMLGWLAHMIQYPEDKPGVAIVVRGLKGSGKDTVANYMGKMFSHHHIVISQQEHFVGRFNQHEEKCLLLHVEEGFWAGNKNAEGTLKSKITSEKVFIEPKGLNGFSVPSVLRIFISSNENWVVPVSSDERRYFVVDIDPIYSRVGALKERRSAYFKALRSEMKDGGPAAFLYYLQNYDISNFDVREVPDTTALGMQKIEALKNVEKWWYAQLLNGELDFDTFNAKGPRFGSGNITRDATCIASFENVFEAYEGWISKRRWEGEALSKSWTGRRLKDMAPSMQKIRGVKDENDDVSNKIYYRIPFLGVLRREFEICMNSKFEWPDNDVIDVEFIDDEDDF